MWGRHLQTGLRRVRHDARTRKKMAAFSIMDHAAISPVPRPRAGDPGTEQLDPILSGRPRQTPRSGRRKFPATAARTATELASSNPDAGPAFTGLHLPRGSLDVTERRQAAVKLPVSSPSIVSLSREAPPLSDSPQEKQNHDDQQDRSQHTARGVTPVSTVRPGWNRPKKHQNQQNNQNGAKHLKPPFVLTGARQSG